MHNFEINHALKVYSISSIGVPESGGNSFLFSTLFSKGEGLTHIV